MTSGGVAFNLLIITACALAVSVSKVQEEMQEASVMFD